jgi:hypothetical protein
MDETVNKQQADDTQNAEVHSWGPAMAALTAVLVVVLVLILIAARQV